MTTSATEPEKQLQHFIGKFERQHQAVIRAARRKLRKRFPTATELAYDNYNFFVIGLCFIRGARLPDPARVLLGSGKQTRFVRLPSADVLDQPAVKALLTVAAERAQTPLPASGRGKLIIRSVSAKQRPRRRKG